MTTARVLTAEEVRDALIEARDIHAEWVDYLRGEGDPKAVQAVTSPGSVRWQLRWVRIYERALELLECKEERTWE